MLYKDKQKDKKILMEIYLMQPNTTTIFYPGCALKNILGSPKCATNGRIDCDVIVYIFAH